jgi:TRAP-type C4-dicarboxylate transport system permease small subunit
MSFAYQEETGGTLGPHPSFEWRPRWLRLLRTVIRTWALIGGLILVALMLMTAASAASNLIFNRPFEGDYEVMKHFIAIAIFCFLPYCQLTGANVTVDIFTENMSERAKSAMLAFSSLFAIVFAAVLLRQMSYGLVGYIRFPETTAALHIPLWTAFPPALVSLALLLVAAVITLIEGVRGMRRPQVPPPSPVE